MAGRGQTINYHGNTKSIVGRILLSDLSGAPERLLLSGWMIKTMRKFTMITWALLGRHQKVWASSRNVFGCHTSRFFLLKKSSSINISTETGAVSSLSWGTILRKTLWHFFCVSVCLFKLSWTSDGRYEVEIEKITNIYEGPLVQIVEVWIQPDRSNAKRGNSGLAMLFYIWTSSDSCRPARFSA